MPRPASRSRGAAGQGTAEPARRGFLALAATAAAAMTGCAGPAPGLQAGPASASRADGRGSRAGVPAWLLTRRALAQVAASEPVAAGLARHRVYELLQPGERPLGLAGALPAVVFASAAQLARAVHAMALPAGTQAVLYDPEAWPFTPAGEQRDPVAATARAAVAAHAAGLQLIAAPALNLVRVLAAGSTAPRTQLFLELGLAARFAAHADMLELQGQSLERDAAQYAEFAAAAARQARRAGAHAGILAGLSTNPPGGPVTASQLVAAIRASAASVDGYWLNIPGRGPRCPACRPTRAGPGIATLRTVL